MATLTVSDYQFHSHPTLYTQASLTVTRSSEATPTISVSGYVYFRTGYYAPNPNVYGGPYYSGANRGLSVTVATPQQSSGNIGSLYNLYQVNGDYQYKDANRIEINQTLEFTSGSLVLYINCKWTRSGTCDQGYDSVPVGVLDISSIPYNPVPPYVPPTGPTTCELSNNSRKPDQDISVTWSGETAGSTGINHFQVEMSQWRGNQQLKDHVKVSGPIYYSTHGTHGGPPCTWTGNLSGLSNYEDSSHTVIKIRPGDRVQFYVACYTGEGNTGWFQTVTATNTGATTGNADVSIYKDGTIKYKDNSGVVHEVTKAYYKDGSGNTQKIRYATVKDGNGATHVIDVYTTLYE